MQPEEKSPEAQTLKEMNPRKARTPKVQPTEAEMIVLVDALHAQLETAITTEFGKIPENVKIDDSLYKTRQGKTAGEHQPIVAVFTYKPRIQFIFSVFNKKETYDKMLAAMLSYIKTTIPA